MKCRSLKINKKNTNRINLFDLKILALRSLTVLEGRNNETINSLLKLDEAVSVMTVLQEKKSNVGSKEMWFNLSRKLLEHSLIMIVFDHTLLQLLIITQQLISKIIKAIRTNVAIKMKDNQTFTIYLWYLHKFHTASHSFSSKRDNFHFLGDTRGMD